MNVQINVPPGRNMETVLSFLSKLKFSNLSVRQIDESLCQVVTDQNQVDPFCIDVVEGSDDLQASKIEALLDSTSCSLLFFNDNVDNDKEPKVVFATDHSNQANKNLDHFKQLKPAGFTGAIVISETDFQNLGTSSEETSRIFLERTKSAAHSSQANLIIANIDLGNLDRKPMQMSNLVRIVLQNKCHVLILKS